MPAQGFKRIDNEDFGPDVYGRVWRIQLRESCPWESVSVGMKDVEQIVLDDGFTHVAYRDKHRLVPTSEIVYVLAEEEPPAQRTLAGWA